MSQSNYKIIYSNTIRIFKDDMPINELPFGSVHGKDFFELRRDMKESGSLKEVSDFYPVKKLFDAPMEEFSVSPREFQVDIVNKLSARGVFNGIVESPTGSGKTNTIAYTIARLNMTSIVIVPTTDLVEQTVERLLSVFGIDKKSNDLIGALGNGKKELGRKILVCTWHSLQTEAIRESVLTYGYNVLFCDEVHRSSANLLSKYIASFKSEKKFGFSASVYRSREEQMEKIYGLVGPKIHSVDVEFLYKMGYILRPEILKIPLQLSANVENGIKLHYEKALMMKKALRWIMANSLFKIPLFKSVRPSKHVSQMIAEPDENDYRLMTQVAVHLRNEKLEEEKRDWRKLPQDEQDELFKKAGSVQLGLAKKGIDNSERRLNEIIKLAPKILAKSENRAAFLFNSISAGRSIAILLENAGFKNIFIVNGQEGNKAEIIEQLSNDEIDDYIIISTVSLLSEGIDIPSLEKIFVCSPVYPPYSSIERLQQIIGRAVRPDPNRPNKRPLAVVLEDVLTDGIVRSKKDTMWGYVDNAFNPHYVSGVGDVELPFFQGYGNEYDSATAIAIY